MVLRCRFPAVFVLAFLLAPPVAALQFSNLFVFGDSIVDVGNTQAVVVGGGDPDPTPAAAGYFDGRFTNGVNPADVLSQAIGLGLSNHSLVGGTNFAFGGATARDDGAGVPDLEAQVAQFNAAVGGVADPNALYVINAGGNDVFDILQGADFLTVVSDATVAIKNSVSALEAAGAHHILFVGVGDVGGTPAVNGGGEAPGRAISQQMNSIIQVNLPSYVDFFDTMALTDDVLADPSLYGLPGGIDLEVPCLFSGAPDPSGPPTCDDFAFFDPIHPSTQLLQILGGQLVAAVPEPGSGVLLALGLVGVASRRRRARA